MQNESPTDSPAAPGFQPRGSGDGRLATFVDAAFAFALTLLVISFDQVPASYAELVQALRGIPAFAASFAIIVMLWVGHHAWSKRYGLEDAVSIVLSLALVFVVMIYVYPLRAMMSAAIATISDGWAPGDFRITSADEVRGLFTIYGAGFSAANACIVLLYVHALRRAGELGLSAYERALTSNDVAIWSLVGSMGLVSIVLARTLPVSLLGFAGWVYSLLGILTPVMAILLGRRAERLR